MRRRVKAAIAAAIVVLATSLFMSGWSLAVEPSCESWTVRSSYCLSGAARYNFLLMTPTAKSACFVVEPSRCEAWNEHPYGRPAIWIWLDVTALLFLFVIWRHQTGPYPCFCIKPVDKS